MNKKLEFSTTKTIIIIAVYFLMFIAGDFISSLFYDFLFSVVNPPSSELCVFLRKITCFCLTFFFFWIYTKKHLHLDFKDFGITFKIKKWGALASVLLPVYVLVAFLIIGTAHVNAFTVSEYILCVSSSMIIALKAGLLEEMLFRGFIMKLLENRWNRRIAIIVPSFIFSLAHIPSMESFSMCGIIMLIVSGTLVGVMFSLVAYKWNSIANSVLMHTVWNFVLITNIFNITTERGAYGTPICSIVIPDGNVLLSGDGFGIEASIVAIVGYAVVCLLMIGKRERI